MAKLVTYKPTKPDSAAGKPAVVKALGQHTKAINQLGVVSNSIGKIAEEMKSIAGATIAFQKFQEKKKKKQARLEKDRAAENKQEGKILPDGPPKGNINEGKNADLKDNETAKDAGTWLERTFGPLSDFLGGIISLVVTKAVFDFMKDPKNRETMQWAIETTQKVFGFFFNWVKGSVENLLGGMGKMFDPEAPFWERIKGFGQMLMGFIGLAALMNPFGMMSAIISLVTNLVDWVKSVIDWWRKKAVKGATEVVDTARDASKVADAADEVKVSWLDDLAESAGNIGKRIADTPVGKAVTGLVDSGKGMVDDLLSGKTVKNVSSGISNFFGGISKGISSGIDWVGKGVKSTVNAALEYGSSLHKKLSSAWSGFGDLLRKYGDKAKNIIIEKVLDPAKKFLEPLVKQMMSIGKTVEKQLMKIPVFEWIVKVLKKKGAKGIGSLGPVLKQIGPKAIDIIGGVVNLVFAYDRFAQGDSIGGLIEGASGILDLSGLPFLVPPTGFVLGPKLSLMLDAYMFARDLLPDMFPEAPDFKEAEDNLINSVGLGGIKGKLDKLLSNLPDLSTITGWITGNADAKDPPIEGEGEDELAAGGEFGRPTRIPLSHLQPMSEGGDLGEKSEAYSMNELEVGEDDVIPFAMPVVKAVAISLPMPINSGGQEVVTGSRSPLLDKI